MDQASIYMVLIGEYITHDVILIKCRQAQGCYNKYWMQGELLAVYQVRIYGVVGEIHYFKAKKIDENASCLQKIPCYCT